jgi:hypothetical protein
MASGARTRARKEASGTTRTAAGAVIVVGRVGIIKIQPWASYNTYTNGAFAKRRASAG